VAFSKYDKVLIKFLRKEKTMEQKKMIKKFHNKSWFLSSLNKLLMKIDQTGTVKCKPDSGKKHKTHLLTMLTQSRSWY